MKIHAKTVFPRILAALLLALGAGTAPAAATPGEALAAELAASAMPSRRALPAAEGPRGFRAPRVAPERALGLGPNLRKATGRALHPDGPEWVATVREAPVPYRVTRWHAVEGGFVARFDARAEGAHGLRVRLDLGTVPGAMDLRAAGPDGRVFAMVLDPTRGPEVWTPWTDGPEQVVEVFSPVRPSDGALVVGAVLNFDVPDGAKAAASCTVSTRCATGDGALDAAIVEARRSVMRIVGIQGGAGFSCSATLVNSPKFPAAYVLTAHHCAGNNQVAGSLTARFFYETTACGTTDADTTFQQVSGGMQLVFSNFNVDTSLLLMYEPPPQAAVYSGFNAARLATGDAVVSLSHPRGDAMRLARGSVIGEIRPATRDTGAYPQDMYAVRWTSGTTEGGSSGSGLFTLSGGALQLRGTLFGGSITADACSTEKLAVYSRMEIFSPQIDPYIRLASVPADDAPNRAIDFTGIPFDPGGAEFFDRLASPITFANRQISPAGDVDVYRFAVTRPRTVAMWSGGGHDLIGTLLNENGDGIWANDDAEQATHDFGITQELQPGTYFLQVAHWEPLGTAPYSLGFATYDVGTNYTDLWWNPSESGWGINVNHQGNILFATLFTYDQDGSGMWLVLDNGARQADGSYSGKLYRTTGPAFNASPWSAINAIEVGTMRLTFWAADEATLTYSVNGVQVTKDIVRQQFGTPASCSWSIFDRSWTFNFQDLWWNPAESGWGLNLAHQGDKLFATLFTYAPGGGKGMWLVMSNGAETSPYAYSGALYRTTGPAFNASPWTPIAATPVGTMTLDFSNAGEPAGDRGTLRYTVDGVTVVKQIQRQVFSQPRTECQ